jgi:hypothetical protein
MSVVDRLVDRGILMRSGAPGSSAERLRARRTAKEASASAAAVNGSAANRARRPPAVTSPELQQRVGELARRYAELQWDLGGIAYEMASRDHFRLDVLTRQAAKLQEVDAELAGLERMVQLAEGGAAGACPSCGALHARAAAFCWKCGHELIEGARNGGAKGR